MIMPPADKSESSPSSSPVSSPISPPRPSKADRIRAQRQETAAPPAYSANDSTFAVAGPSPASTSAPPAPVPASVPSRSLAPGPVPTARRTASKTSLPKSSESHTSKEGSSGGRALKMGMLGILVAPVAILYGCGKLIEGIGKAISVGPEKMLEAYRSPGKSKSKGNGASSS